MMKNELPVIETTTEEKQKNKGGVGVGRISRLFQKKTKKKPEPDSTSLSKQETCHSSASIASSQTSANYMPETDRNSFLSVQQQQPYDTGKYLNN